MRSPLFMVLLLVAALPFTIACRGTNDQAEVDDKDDTATQTTEKEIAGTNQPNDLNPVEAQTFVDDVTIGHKVGSDGLIAAADQDDDFAPGDPIYITMKVGDAPAGSKVKVAWYGPGETKIDEENKTVGQGPSYITFQAPATTTWDKGDYHAEVWIGDEKVNQQEFNITDKSKAGK